MSIVVVDKKFIIHHWNKETETIYGITAKQVLGKNLIELFPDLKRIKLDNYIKSVFETGKKREIKEKFRKTLLRGDIYIDYFISPIMVDNKIEYISLASKEVTERVHLRHNLQERNERLSILYDIAKTLFSTLNLEEVLFLILTGITNPKMEGFNRAALFKLDKTSQGRIFTGIMGVGKKSGNEAHKLWKKLLKNPRYFDNFSLAYNNFIENQNPTFNSFVQGLGFFQKDLKKNSRLRGITHFKVGGKRNKPPKILLDFFNIKEFVLVPIYVEKELFGIIYVDNYKSKKEFDKSDIEFLELSTNLASMAIQLSKKYEETYESTIRDSLTKLFNHRRFYSILKEQIAFAKESKGKLSIVMLDLDYFKKYNDTFGHIEGDQVLRDVSSIILSKVRNIDFAARYGGEEFALILPNINKDEARNIAERIREAVQEHEFKKSKEITWGRVTISGGIATYPGDSKKFIDLVKIADEMLYKAKSKGRNKILTTKK